MVELINQILFFTIPIGILSAIYYFSGIALESTSNFLLRVPLFFLNLGSLLFSFISVCTLLSITILNPLARYIQQEDSAEKNAYGKEGILDTLKRGLGYIFCFIFLPALLAHMVMQLFVINLTVIVLDKSEIDPFLIIAGYFISFILFFNQFKITLKAARSEMQETTQAFFNLGQTIHLIDKLGKLYEKDGSKKIIGVEEIGGDVSTLLESLKGSEGSNYLSVVYFNNYIQNKSPLIAGLIKKAKEKTESKEDAENRERVSKILASYEKLYKK